MIKKAIIISGPHRIRNLFYLHGKLRKPNKNEFILITQKIFYINMTRIVHNFGPIYNLREKLDSFHS